MNWDRVEGTTTVRRFGFDRTRRGIAPPKVRETLMCQKDPTTP